jgi:catechol 2,3-dioxygenase-like lactoylglutathione lyase family enzyme
MRADTTAPTWVDIRTPPPHGDPPGLIIGYSAVAVEVRDVERALVFYSGVLGFPVHKTAPDNAQLLLNPRQWLALVKRDETRVVPESAVHQACTVPAGQLGPIGARVTAAGGEVHRYHEDREAERHDNCYVVDPDGNRVQLVAGATYGIDHAVVETHDLEWAEVFYTQVLDARIESRVGWKMADFARAWDWGNGKDDCMPGSRRWETLYTGDRARVPRPTAQLFVQFAPGVSFGIYLAGEHRSEPPRGQFWGTPTTSFLVQTGGLGELERRLRGIRLRCMEASAKTGGPYERVDNILLVRDPGGNFLEFREQSA